MLEQGISPHPNELGLPRIGRPRSADFSRPNRRPELPERDKAGQAAQVSPRCCTDRNAPQGARLRVIRGIAVWQWSDDSLLRACRTSFLKSLRAPAPFQDSP